MVKERTERTRGRKEDKSRYVPKHRPCPFCRDKITEIDYKDTGKLIHFISARGKIEPRRRTAACAKHQRALAIAIKRARHLALLPFAPEHIHQMGMPLSVNRPLSPAAAVQPASPAAEP